MSKGYLTIVQNTSDVDYLKLAYGLALSIKISQSSINNISICVDKETKKKIKAKHKKVFDKIIDIPWGDAAKGEEWKIHNKWKYLYMTPYEETVVLDCDMIFPRDISHWWNSLSMHDVWATTSVRTFRDNVVDSTYYRETFVMNELPNVYTAFMYFKKSELASELFAMAEIVFQHWKRFFHKYLPKKNPERLSGDVAFALAMKLLDAEHECCRENINTIPTFVHMKSYAQDVENHLLHEDWTKSLPTYFTDSTDFKVGNFKQDLPFHYSEKSWLTDEMIQKMEEQLYDYS